MSKVLHLPSPRGGILPDTQDSQGSSSSNGTVDACEWYTFPSPVALFPSEEQLCPCWLGPRAGLFLVAKIKNRFPCRQLSLGWSGFTHDRSANIKPLNYTLLDILGPDDTVRHLLRNFTAHHKGSEDRERPWQWPLYRVTSCSKRHMSAAALVRGAHLYCPGYFRLFSFFLQCITSLKFCPGLYGARSCLVLPCIDSMLVFQTSSAEADWLHPAYRRTSQRYHGRVPLFRYVTHIYHQSFREQDNKK